MSNKFAGKKTAIQDISLLSVTKGHYRLGTLAISLAQRSITFNFGTQVSLVLILRSWGLGKIKKNWGHHKRPKMRLLGCIMGSYLDDNCLKPKKTWYFTIYI